jgi:Zn-dependent protease
MLLRSLDDLVKDPLHFLIILCATVIALAIAITVHEFSHAMIAYRLGDSTAKIHGRLSLNPMVHLDPFGTAMLFLVGLGWGKPVPVDIANFNRFRRQAMALVSIGGPISNLITAAIFALPINLGFMPWRSPFSMSIFKNGTDLILPDLFGTIIFYNLILAVFNLIPIAPLDGFKVALGVLPRGFAEILMKYEPYGPVVLLVVFVLDFWLGIHILSSIIGPAIEFFGRIILLT